MTFKESPKPAIMNANSPICAKENPDCIAILSGFPDNKIPKLAKKMGSYEEACNFGRRDLNIYVIG